MINFALEEQRCEKCQKLLFRGLIGIGFLEVKCGRCGHVNTLNSYDVMLYNTPGAYIIIYDKNGNLIATSKSAEKNLGYSEVELTKLTMNHLDAKFKPQAISSAGKVETLEQWGKLRKDFPSQVTHTTKSGQALHNSARYYPIGSSHGIYTVGIFFGERPQ